MVLNQYYMALDRLITKDEIWKRIKRNGMKRGEE